MKKIFTISFFILFIFSTGAQTPCENGYAGIYPCENVDLLSYMSLNDIGCGQNTNDIWGWVSPSGREYAIVGCDNGTSFVEVTDPINPVYIGILPAHNNPSLWRDVETYNNYVFSVSEANYHGLQIMDLLQLDGIANPPVTFTEDAYYDGFGHCHTLNINTESGFLYANGTSTFEGGQHIVDISDPLNPVLAGGFEADGYTHDCYVLTYDGPDADYTGKEIVVACNEDAVTVVDVTDKSDCQEIQSYEYPNTGYTHQGWFTEDKKYFLVDDELDENYLDLTLRTHIFNFNDLDNVEYMGFYDFGLTSPDHNLYINGNYAYESNYTTGVRILDLTNVATADLTEAGYFDLYPSGDFMEYEGTWSNYPFLPSGTILATSMYDGIFFLKFAMLSGVEKNIQLTTQIKLQPNPSNEVVTITSEEPLNWIQITDVTGKVVKNETINKLRTVVLNVSTLESGVYFITTDISSQPVKMLHN